MTQGSNVAKSITFQFGDVHKPLMSVSRLADVGYDCILGKDGGKLVDTVTGEVIPLQRRGNLYFVNAFSFCYFYDSNLLVQLLLGFVTLLDQKRYVDSLIVMRHTLQYFCVREQIKREY